MPRLSGLTGNGVKGEKMNVDMQSGAGLDLIRQVLESVEEEFRISKKENVHLKERLQELLK